MKHEYFLQLIDNRGASYVGPLGRFDEAKELNLLLRPVKRGFVMKSCSRISFTVLYPEVVSPEDFRKGLG